MSMRINLKSDLLASALNIGGMSMIKLVSALILTRLLYQEAYGIVATAQRPRPPAIAAVSTERTSRARQMPRGRAGRGA